MRLSAFVIALCFLFSATVLGDDLSSFSLSAEPNKYSNGQTFKGYTKYGVLGFGSTYDEYPILSEPQAVTLKSEQNSSIRGFRHPRHLESSPTNRIYFCNYPSGAQGELVYLDKGVAAVRAPCPSEGHGGSEDEDIYFFPANQVQLAGQPEASPQDESKTEAAYVPEGVATPASPSLSRLPIDKIEGTISSESLVSQRSSKSYFSSTEEYLKCYPTPYQEKYDKHLKEAIEIASQEFNVTLNPVTGEEVYLGLSMENHDPVAQLVSAKTLKSRSNWIDIHPHADVLKCLFRKESLFDPSKTSHTGAAGLGQQVDGNIKEIKCMLYGCTQKGHKRRPEPWAKAVMESYHQKINLLPKKTKDFLWTNSKTGKRCEPRISSKSDAYCPIHSITATALYQVKLESIIRRNYDRFKLHGDFEGDELIYVSAIMAAGHNAGETHIGRISDLDDPASWDQRLVAIQTSKRRSEVKGYVESMKACIGGDKKPMYPGDRMSQDPICLKPDVKLPDKVPVPTPSPRSRGTR